MRPLTRLSAFGDRSVVLNHISHGRRRLVVYNLLSASNDSVQGLVDDGHMPTGGRGQLLTVMRTSPAVDVVQTGPGGLALRAHRQRLHLPYVTAQTPAHLLFGKGRYPILPLAKAAPFSNLSHPGLSIGLNVRMKVLYWSALPTINAATLTSGNYPCCDVCMISSMIQPTVWLNDP